MGSRRLAREWMGIEPTKQCLYTASTALKAAEPTRCPGTPRAAGMLLGSAGFVKTHGSDSAQACVSTAIGAGAQGVAPRERARGVGKAEPFSRVRSAAIAGGSVVHWSGTYFPERC